VERDYVGIAKQYEDDVRRKRIPACKWVRLACERNAKDRKRQKTKGFPFWFDPAAATAICQAAEALPHIKGPKARIVGYDEEQRAIWQTIELEPWQCWMLTTVFGWKQVGTNTRRFKTVLILVPRKNAKSTLLAIVLLFMLTADGEVGAECYSAATTRDQAKVVAEIAWHMAQRSPQFRDYFGVLVGAKTTKVLEVPATASKASPLSADAQSLDGLNVHLAAIDELHAHRTRDVWDVLETATGAREQPIIWAISTAGVQTAGICFEQLTYLHKILDGVIADETYFGINYTIDDGDDWESELAWRKANPNYGVSVRADDLKRKAVKAKASPASINNFLTKHLNVWVKAEASWMPMQKWHACGNPKLKIEDFTDVPCWIGVDLAEVRDIAATIALFRPEPGLYVAFGRFYLPEETVDRSPIAQYSGWVHAEHLIATDGDVADFARIEDDIVGWCETLNVRAVCFDRALAAQMQQRLQDRLAGGAEVLTVGQGVDVMNPAMQTLERLVFQKKLRHDGNPVLTWMASNVVVVPSHKDEVYPRKAGGKDSHNKIDGIVALLTALSVADRESGDGSSVYDEEEVFVL